MSLIVVLLLAVCAAPVLTGGLALAENLRAGQLARVRRLCNGALLPALVRSLVNSVWSLWLTALALPFGRVSRRPAPGPFSGTPVLLVHGLYHNPAAWFVLRRRLALAGFGDTVAYGYSSFGPDFATIAAGLARVIRKSAENSPTGRVLLVGHSLGGLVIRAACASIREGGGEAVCPLVAGMVTLGTPHRGSTLATMLAVGRLGRGLRPGGEALRILEGLEECNAPGLSLYSPTDAMVLPLSGSLLTERMRAAGWREQCLGPVSHVGLLYHREAARLTMGFLKGCAAGASFPAVP